MVPLRVECADSADEAEGGGEPCAVWLEGERLEVLSVIDRWHHGGPGRAGGPVTHYKLDCGTRVLIVKYVEEQHVWYLSAELES